MKQLLFTLFILASHSTFSQILTEDYIQEWKSFYPGNALQMGLHESVFHFEDRSETEINQWLNYNQMILQKIENSEPSEIPADKINTRLLRSQIMTELQKWEKDPPHQTSLRFYTQLFNQALNKFSRVKFLTWDDQHLLQLEAYESINSNCIHLIRNLKSIKDQDPDQSIDQLRSILNIMNRHKSQVEHKMALSKNDEEVLLKTEQALASLEKAQSHVESLPRESQTPVLGPEEYARRLTIYTDSDLSPKQMESMALHEIKVTRQLMKEVAGKYLKARYPEKSLPEKEDDIIKMALDDMEKDVVTSAEEYLTFWEELAEDAAQFIEQQNIATLPEYSTLRIKTAPESAGAAARIGWVASAPPFAPNPVTTLYLPSIPDTLPQQEQIDFWSSFNKPFNRMIVIHELIPGHYMQLKISRETPHKIRLLFPYGPYIEGWATFCEMIALDQGWEKERPLTYLAHLRKRLENANRAYTSVMVHCNGWDQDQVMKFSTETSLLAPQFAKSLWGRLMRSPMQITSYFYGGALFKKLYADEKERLGEQFVLKDFMDTIMKAGPIPIDEFYHIFEDQR